MARRNLYYLYAYRGDKLASTAFACGFWALPLFFSAFFFLSCQRLKQIIKYIALPSGGERGGSIKRLFYGPFVHLSSQPKALGNCGNALLPCPEAWVIGSGHKGRLLTQQ